MELTTNYILASSEVTYLVLPGMSSAIINPFIYAKFNVCSGRRRQQSANGSSQPVQQILCRRGPHYQLVRRPAYELQRNHPMLMRKPYNAYPFVLQTFAKQTPFPTREENDYHW